MATKIRVKTASKPHLTVAETFINFDAPDEDISKLANALCKTVEDHWPREEGLVVEWKDI